MMLTAIFLVLAIDPPHLQRVQPLGAMRGSTAVVEFTGENLAGTKEVRFDSADLHWIETIEIAKERIKGKVSVAPKAALGPHLIHVTGADGRSNSRLFNVTQFPGVEEVEPNDTPAKAQRIELKPQIIHGYLNGHPDIDVYSFQARAGERWVFDLRSLEYGGFLECNMSLLDERGREVDFNDDRDDYLETPLIEHTFASDGVYRLRVDQYRGPQGVDCGRNCGYMLQISQLPVVLAASPLGAQAEATVTVTLHGKGLANATSAYLTAVRNSEYYRLTFPFTMPVRLGRDPQDKPIPGTLTRKSATSAEFQFAIPATATPGLWRIWVDAGASGIAEATAFEISAESESRTLQLTAAATSIVNGALTRQGQQDSYWIDVQAGQPLHAWTLAAQFGSPYLDTVLELFDEQGKLLAEHDDLMTGQGTVMGNPDSSLYYTPKQSGRVRLVVRDRTGRGGPEYAYRLKLKSEKPGFRVMTDPEECNVARGGEYTIEALLLRDPGFDEAVDVWIEGLPNGVEAPKGRFRADQHFGPSGDGDNVNIPDVPLKLAIPANTPPGDYPIRIRARAATTAGSPVVDAFTTMWIGPPRKRNDVRRPLPSIVLTVIDRQDTR